MVTVTNTGNVRLQDIAVKPSSGTASCTTAATGPIAVGARVYCSFVALTSQDDFEAASISTSLTITAAAAGTNSSLLQSTQVARVALMQLPALTVNLVGAANQTAVAVAGGMLWAC